MEDGADDDLKTRTPHNDVGNKKCSKSPTRSSLLLIFDLFPLSLKLSSSNAAHLHQHWRQWWSLLATPGRKQCSKSTLLTLFGLPEGAPLELMEIGHEQQHEEGI